MAVSSPEDTARGDGAADTDSNFWASTNVANLCLEMDVVSEAFNEQENRVAPLKRENEIKK